ncbi:MAG: Plug domain-containing protein [Prevotella sp.]|nr:Plug domain-containing protein [Prevotella sp.]
MMRFVCRGMMALMLPMEAWGQSQSDSIIHKTHKINEVVVMGNNAQHDNLYSTQMGGARLSGESIAKMPTLLGEPDVLKALQMQSGVSTGVEGFSGMYVRGGENDENLYLLNHLPLYHVTHIGGLFSSFNVPMIDHVDFFKAGYPVNYGGRISSITDVSLKESNFKELHGSVSLGLLSGNAYVTGPSSKTNWHFL